LQEYYTSGYLSLQAAIDAYVLDLSAQLETSLNTGPNVSDSYAPAQPQYWSAWGGVFPTAEYEHNEFYDAVGPMLGLLMSLSLVYPLSMLVRGIVEEREKRLKETMSIMGLQGVPSYAILPKNLRSCCPLFSPLCALLRFFFWLITGWVLHVAWVATYAIILLVICIAVTIVCCTSFLRASDPLLLFLLLLFFAASEVAFGLMVAAFFNNAKIAGVVAPLAHFACLLPRYIFFRSEAPQVTSQDRPHVHQLAC
jgi:hypothetical protein